MLKLHALAQTLSTSLLSDQEDIMAAEPLVISIWQVDPVGGTYVDWPAKDDETAYIKIPDQFKSMLSCSEIRENGWKQLVSIGEKLPDVWVPHEVLEAVDSELSLLAAWSGIEDYSPEIRSEIKNIQNACQFALTIPDGGVCIG